MAATHSPLTLRSIANPKSLSLQLSQQGWRKGKPPEWGPGVPDHLSPLTKTAHAGQAGAESAKDGPEQNRPRFPGGQRRGAVGSGAEAQPFGPPLRLRRCVGTYNTGRSQLRILVCKDPSRSKTRDICTSPAKEVYSAITCTHDSLTTGCGVRDTASPPAGPNPSEPVSGPHKKGRRLHAEPPQGPDSYLVGNQGPERSQNTPRHPS